MALAMELWKIEGEKLSQIDKASLDLEKHLENWIERDITLIGIDALIIGRQVHTDYGGFIDLLAIDGDGDLIIIELKRKKTPRDIISQCLDYGTWVHGLEFEGVTEIYQSYKQKDLSEEFAEYFGTTIPDKINNNYQIVIVAESVDESTERVVQHLNEIYKVNINVVFFNIFISDGHKIIGRSWLKDPVDVEEKSSAGKKSKWTGYYFVNTGISDDNARDWKLNRKYEFVSAGGSLRYINAMKKLNKGDKLFAFISGRGYVAYGMVEENAVPVKNFKIDEKLITDDLPDSHPWRQNRDVSKEEWLVKVKWFKTFDENSAQWFKGAFANQNAVCKLRDQNTFKFLSEKFDLEKPL